MALKNHSSRLARLQQTLVLAALAMAAGWAWATWDKGLFWALGGVAWILFSYVLVLGLQFILVVSQRGADPAPRASAFELLAAWWQEVRVAPTVFVWRQPFRWKSLPDTAASGANQPLPSIVFVHGFVCNRGFWLPWMARLRERGQAYVSVNLEPVFGSIDDYLPLIEAAVCRAEEAGGPPPVLICHSMGGLAVRAWMAESAAHASRVGKVITIGSPHHGTWLGRFSHLPNGRQMRTDSGWLQALQRREQDLRPQRTYAAFVCWYSSADNIVFPASTATLEGADNRFLAATPHVAMAFDPAVMAESLALCASAANPSAARDAE